MKKKELKLHTVEIKYLRRMIGVTRRDRIQNSAVRQRTNIRDGLEREFRDYQQELFIYWHVTGGRMKTSKSG